MKTEQDKAAKLLALRNKRVKYATEQAWLISAIAKLDAKINALTKAD